jgi:hypothetical protein
MNFNRHSFKIDEQKIYKEKIGKSTNMVGDFTISPSVVTQADFLKKSQMARAGAEMWLRW